MPRPPKISIFGSAVRTNQWMALYNSIGDNTIDFEIVFVGPVEPTFTLPHNFRYIKSNVKPSQSWEIALRNTTGDYVMNIADDCEFSTPHPLDALYECYRSYNNDLLIVSSKFMTNGEDLSAWAQRYFVDDPNSPVMPLCGLMSKKLYQDVGGIDRNFIAIMWDLDIAMRVYALGGNVVMSNVYINEDKKKSGVSNLYPEFSRHDRGLLDKLWTTNGKVHLNRARPVQSFSDVNILTASQGPRGRWRGSHPMFLERIEDRLAPYWAICARAYRGLKKPSMYPNYGKRLASRLKGR